MHQMSSVEVLKIMRGGKFLSDCECWKKNYVQHHTKALRGWLVEKQKVVQVGICMNGMKKKGSLMRFVTWLNAHEANARPKRKY